MQIHILAVGRLRRSVERDLFETYIRRIRWPITVREVEDRGADDSGRRERESTLLLAAIPSGAVVVALDETGKELTSPALAERLGRWQDDGVADVAFLIGGADGLSASARQRADLVLAFGRATWPHLLVRAMLAEQLYRAQQIRAGHPYHRG